jgi:hypothetical protein
MIYRDFYEELMKNKTFSRLSRIMLDDDAVLEETFVLDVPNRINGVSIGKVVCSQPFSSSKPLQSGNKGGKIGATPSNPNIASEIVLKSKTDNIQSDNR